jgi:ketosteroid isomerase-like protein
VTTEAAPDERIALTQSAWEAYEAGDIERLLSMLDPEVVVEVPVELGNAGTFRGHDQFVKWLGAWQEAWESFEMQTIGAVAVGDRHVVCDMAQTGVGRGSGIEVNRKMGWLFEFRDGRTVHIELFSEFDSALAAAREREELGGDAGA